MPWFICDVKKAGPANDGNVYIHLQELKKMTGNGYIPEQAFNCWFVAVDSQRKELLATALAAISTGYHVEAELPNSPTEYAQLTRMYLTRID